MFDPLELREVASELAGREEAPESYLRSAINRTYFSVHLKAAWGLERLGLFEPQRAAPDHGKVVQLLRPHRRRAAERLNDLRRLRDSADYDLNVVISPQDWRSAESCANFVVNFLAADWQRAETL